MDKQRVRITKILLKESLIKLLQEKSIKKISILEICNQAQINRSTFYRYYGSQYELLEDIEDDMFNGIEDYMVGKCGNISRLAQMLMFLESNDIIFNTLMNPNVDGDFPTKLMSLKSVMMVMNDQFKNSYHKDKEYLFEFISRGGYEVIRIWLNKENRESPINLAEIIEDMISKLQ